MSKIFFYVEIVVCYKREGEKKWNWVDTNNNMLWGRYKKEVKVREGKKGLVGDKWKILSENVVK